MQLPHLLRRRRQLLPGVSPGRAAGSQGTLQRAANSDGLVCYRLQVPADSERATGVERKRPHVLTYLRRATLIVRSVAVLCYDMG